MKKSTYIVLGLLWVALPTFTALGESVEERGQSRVKPWSGYWWPHRQGAMLGPLSKYDSLTGKRAAEWERKNHPPGSGVPEWHGYCHAWAASSLMEREPVKQRSLGDEEHRVSLGVGDQKGLLAACHARDVANVWGDRFGDGRGTEDQQDLAPDTLWRLLKLYIKQRGVPLVLDLEAGREVWNYPIYAYRIRFSPQGGGGKHLAKLTLWMADDAVAPDYVGVKVRRQTYQFSFVKREGAVVMGSAKWVGGSREDHPDFAWYPYLAVADNPEVDYATVQRLVGARQPSEPTLPERPSPPTEPATPVVTPRIANEPTPDPDHPNADAAVADAPVANTAVANTAPRAVVLSPMELTALVANETSSFRLDISVDRFGGRYDVGDPLVVSGVSDRTGYLTLLHIAADGQLALLYPRPGQDNRVFAKREFSTPARSAEGVIRAVKPLGNHRIKAVVTSRPLQLSGLECPPRALDNGGAKGEPTRRDQTGPRLTGQRLTGSPAIDAIVRTTWRLGLRWHPTQRRLIRKILLACLGERTPELAQVAGGDPREVLGEFAQDEATFYVGPKGDEAVRADDAKSKKSAASRNNEREGVSKQTRAQRKRQ